MMRLALLFALAIPAAGAAEPQWTRAALERLAALAAEKHGVPRALVQGACKIESAWQPHAIGDDGASIGVCQIKIDTALDLYGRNWLRDRPTDERREAVRKILFNPAANIQLSALLLRRYLDRFAGDETLALMAYNGGPDHPLIKYVTKARAAQAQYQETP